MDIYKTDCLEVTLNQLSRVSTNYYDPNSRPNLHNEYFDLVFYPLIFV